ncbi:MAG: CAP domain-containing protein, partial [Actinomycetota bacterium]|nr:CAP domain-containing protein [Actinomycetota bacterium]
GLAVAGAVAVDTQPAGASTPSATRAGIARAVLTRLNAERASYRLPALRMNVHLISSAHSHNVAMAAYNTMSHQLPHEAYFTTRISRAGYRWSWAGENVAWNSVENQAGALALEGMMFNERAPYNAHRLNILSRRFTDIGIDIYIDARTQKLWMTEDFGRPA